MTRRVALLVVLAVSLTGCRPGNDVTGRRDVISELRVAPAGDVGRVLTEQLLAGPRVGTAPKGWSVRVLYGANPCSRAARVHVSERAGGGWTIGIRPRARGGCDDVLVVWAVDLKTTRMLSPLHVEMR